MNKWINTHTNDKISEWMHKMQIGKVIIEKLDIKNKKNKKNKCRQHNDVKKSIIIITLVIDFRIFPEIGVESSSSKLIEKTRKRVEMVL